MPKNQKHVNRIIGKENRQQAEDVGAFGKSEMTMCVVLYVMQGRACGVLLHDCVCLFICLWRLDSLILVLFFLCL